MLKQKIKETTYDDYPSDKKKKEFDKKLKSHFLEKLSSTIVCDRLFCPVCSTAAIP
jgi:hypothetical protein